MPLVRYDRPAKHTLTAFGQTIAGGMTADLSDDELQSLLAQGEPFTVLDDGAADEPRGDADTQEDGEAPESADAQARKPDTKEK